jgi:hypothetical protein
VAVHYNRHRASLLLQHFNALVFLNAKSDLLSKYPNFASIPKYNHTMYLTGIRPISLWYNFDSICCIYFVILSGISAAVADSCMFLFSAGTLKPVFCASGYTISG